MVEGGGIEEGGLAVWVEVAKSGAELLPGLDDLGGGVEFPVSDGVVDDLDGLEVGLEFDEVVHHGLGGRIEVLLTEGVEILQPQFLEGCPYVLRLEFFE